MGLYRHFSQGQRRWLPYRPLPSSFKGMLGLEGDEWGFTGTFHKDNGGGFLTDHYPEATKACWDFEGIFAQSRHIPGVRFAGLIHPGLIGTAPSAELLRIWNSREKALNDKGDKATTLCSIHHT